MKLTRVERWILSNQYQILELLDSNEEKYYKMARTILEKGYEIHYEEISQHVYEEKYILSEDACSEIIYILDMFATMKRTVEMIDDKTGIDIYLTQFSGFDGNNEPTERAYANFFCHEQSSPRFTELDFPADLNSHSPTIDAYRRMLIEWENSKDKYELTKEDIIRITSARHYPKN